MTGTTRQLVVSLMLAFVAGGCKSVSQWSLPYTGDDPTIRDTALYENTKAGKVDRIRRIGEAAGRQSLDEQRQSVADLVKQIETESDATLRHELVQALGQFTTPATIDGFRLALRDPRPKVRIAACQGLGNSTSAESLSLLRSVLTSDANLDVRVAATRAISQFDGPAAIKALQPAINDADPALQYAAVRAMKKIHTEDLGHSVAAWQQLARSISATEPRVARDPADRRDYR